MNWRFIEKWYPEDDPILREQVETLVALLDGHPTEAALEGFLIVCSRFVDEFGSHRTHELASIFRTDRPEGRAALSRSLEFMCRWTGGMDGYLKNYPVTIIPPRPAFPQFRVLGIEILAGRLFRVLDSRGIAYPGKEPITEFIIRTGHLPSVPRQRRPVRRTKPRFHWCTYDAWSNPEETRQALQILPAWSDCRLRAAISTAKVSTPPTWHSTATATIRAIPGSDSTNTSMSRWLRITRN